MIACNQGGPCEAGQCVRYESINNGQPLKIFYDDSNLPSGFYVNLTEEPLEFLQQAMVIWNLAYPCGNLFELTTDFDEADVVLNFYTQDGDTAYARATCLCNVGDGTICDNLDKGMTYSPDNKGFIGFNLHPPNANGTEAFFLYAMVHELGHILGMGHVFDQGIVSVMGLPPEGESFSSELSPWDQEQLRLRYPCCNPARPTPLGLRAQAVDEAQFDPNSNCGTLIYG